MRLLASLERCTICEFAVKHVERKDLQGHSCKNFMQIDFVSYIFVNVDLIVTSKRIMRDLLRYLYIDPTIL